MKSKKSPLWKDVLEIIAAFAVAWLFYQFLIFVLGTPMPIVSVVSDSMYHEQQFGEWWGNNKNFYEPLNITKEKFVSFVAANGLSRGDLLVVVGEKDLKVGDVVIYQRDSPFTIVHRVIEKNDEGYIIKGDNNAVADSGIIKKEQILGKVVFAAPLLGYPRLILYAFGV